MQAFHPSALTWLTGETKATFGLLYLVLFWLIIRICTMLRKDVDFITILNMELSFNEKIWLANYTLAAIQTVNIIKCNGKAPSETMTAAVAHINSFSNWVLCTSLMGGNWQKVKCIEVAWECLKKMTKLGIVGVGYLCIAFNSQSGG